MIRLPASLLAMALLGSLTAAHGELSTPSPYGTLAAAPSKLVTRTVTASAKPMAPSPKALNKLAFRLIARQEADKAGVPFDLVDAVMKIESDFDPTRRGDVGEIGLMQVRPGTASMLGFRGDEAILATPAVNIHYGATYLGKAWHLANGNVCRALMKYRAGHGNESMSPLSVTYCSRARAYLSAIQSPLAVSIKSADLVATTPDQSAPLKMAPLPGGLGRTRSSAHFWTTFEARIKRINARIEAKWRRTASR